MFRMIIASVVLAIATTAQASSSTLLVEGGPSARVAYSDLDLKSPAGRTRLSGRIQSAAGSLCLENNIEPLDVKLQQLDCYRVAITSGVQQMNSIAGR